MRRKKFKTKFARKKYISWNKIIRKARRDKAPRSTIKMMKRFQRSWIGK